MSEARTVWHDLQTKQTVARGHHTVTALLGALLLCAFAVTEVVWLMHSGVPGAANIAAAAEGMPLNTDGMSGGL